MFTWIKKRCSRQSVYMREKNRNRKLPSSGSAEDTMPFYFQLEDNYLQLDHSYQEIPETRRNTSHIIYEDKERVTSLTHELESDVTCESHVCMICRRNYSIVSERDSICSCYAEPVHVLYQNISPNASLDFSHLQCEEDYDPLSQSYNLNHSYSTVPNEQRRRLFRSRSDIRRRPLPTLPMEDEVISESESSGFYETIDSDDECSIIGPYMSASILV